MKPFLWKVHLCIIYIDTYQNNISVMFCHVKPVCGNGLDQDSMPDATASPAAVVSGKIKGAEGKTAKFNCDLQCSLHHLWWCLQAVTLRVLDIILALITSSLLNFSSTFLTLFLSSTLFLCHLSIMCPQALVCISLHIHPALLIQGKA